MTFANWNQGLLIALVQIVIGSMLFTGAASSRQRSIAVGIIAQAIVLAFVVSGAFHRNSDLSLAATSMAIVFVLWSVIAGSDAATEKDDRSGGATEQNDLIVTPEPTADAEASP